MDENRFVTKEEFNNFGLIIFWIMGVGAFLSGQLIVGIICLAMQFLYLLRCKDRMKAMVLVILGISLILYFSSGARFLR